MLTTRARGRYLAALGLTTAFGCRGAEPASQVAPTASATGAAAASVTHHTGPWVPPVEPELPMRPGTCPHGPFCVPAPPDTGATAAPAPYQACAASVPMPDSIRPGMGRTPTVTFDAKRTASERASDPAACCYEWHVLCVGGRALRGDEGPLTAAIVRRDDWLAPDGAVAVEAIAPEVRAALAAHWEREAAFEHASIASFARASLALLAVGAPPELVAATHAAAMDEVEHARVAYALASAYAGARRGPGELALPATLHAPSLVELAEETFVDGCAGEATAALVLREAAAASRDPAVRKILARLADDEERHAELAWRTVAWALDAGGAEVRDALARTLATLRCDAGREADVCDEAGADLASHGALGAALRGDVRRRSILEVVVPCATALLAAGRPVVEA